MLFLKMPSETALKIQIIKHMRIISYLLCKPLLAAMLYYGEPTDGKAPDILFFSMATVAMLNTLP